MQYPGSDLVCATIFLSMLRYVLRKLNASGGTLDAKGLGAIEARPLPSPRPMTAGDIKVMVRARVVVRAGMRVMSQDGRHHRTVALGPA